MLDVTGLPTGTVTLLFSDVEGSTALLHTLGPQWGEALSAQRSILRSAFAEHGGTEMGTEGDSFFVVFGSAHEAVGAAISGQRGLQRHTWPGGATVRVRMGLHTGEPQRHEDGYIGEDVHRAARIASTAHGGQIVLSEATRRLVSDLAEAQLRDLGRHRLKDLPDSEHLYDVVVADLLSRFPPLRSLGRSASLPRPPTSMVGRDAELETVSALLDDSQTRLVTLTGPGGSGKTRLAIGVAARRESSYRDGVFFVGLHAVDTGAAVWPAIGDVLGSGTAAGPGPAEQVCNDLAGRRALLVLDNLEQIPDADVVVSSLLSAAPEVQILVASRRPLLLVAEHELPVAPLELPASSAFMQVMDSAAVQLFRRQARMVRPAFELNEGNCAAVAAVCERLDGLPLALELAAAQVRMLSPAALLSRLDSRLGAGSTAADRPDRQRSLGATIAWSHDLLAESDQVVFRRLGVFRAPADLDAVTAVAGSEGLDIFDVISRLAGTNLVRIEDDADGEPRVSMLETIRTYALERLDEAGEAERTRMRHLVWCRDLVEQATQLLRGPLHTRALDRLGLIEDDVRAALEFGLSEGDPERLAVAHELLITVTTRYWYRFGSVAEGRAWQERGLGVADESDSASNVGLLRGLGISLLQQTDVDASIELFDRSLQMAQRLGERDLEARALNDLAIARRQQGDFAGSMALLRQSLEITRSTGNLALQAISLGNLVVVHIDLRDYAGAAEAAQESMRANAANGDEWGVAIDRLNYTAAVLKGEGPRQALRHYDEWAEGVLAFRDNELALDLTELGAAIAAGLGEHASAARLLAAADAQRTAISVPRSPAEDALVQEWTAASRAALAAPEWQRHYASGTALDADAAVAVVRALAVGERTR